MSSGFQSDGPAAYRQELDQHYGDRLKALGVRLKNSTDEVEREKIRSEIQATQSEFNQKVAEIDMLIF